MLLAYIIYIVYLLFAIHNLRKAILAWMPIQLFFINPQIALRYNSPAIYLNLAIEMSLLIIYLSKTGVQLRKERFNDSKFLFGSILTVTAVSYFLSLLFSIVSFSSVMMETIRTFLSNFLFLYLFQKALSSKKDVKYVLLCCFSVIVPIFLLGLYESIFRDNPWLDYVYLHSNIEYMRMYYRPPFISGGPWIRYGFVRAYSFFYIHIQYGAICVFLLALLVPYYKLKGLGVNRSWLIASSIMLVTCVLMSNSKTSMVGIIPIIFLVFLNTPPSKRLSYVMPLTIALIAAILLVPGYFDNLFSLVDESIDDGGGSNVQMRKRQLEVALGMFAKSPIFGNGIGSISVLEKFGDNADILGSESVWLKLLPERGILGVFVYIYSLYYMYDRFQLRIPKMILLSFLASLVLMETSTGFMPMSIYGSVLIMLYRSFDSKNFMATSRTDYYNTL